MTYSSTSSPTPPSRDYVDVQALLTGSNRSLFASAGVLTALVYIMNFWRGFALYTTVAYLGVAVVLFVILSPNSRACVRFLPGFVLTSLLGGVCVAHREHLLSDARFGNIVGLVGWACLAYWLIGGIGWTWKTHREHRGARASGEDDILLHTWALILATWGATLQVSFVLGWFLAPVRAMAEHSTLLRSLLSVVGAMKRTSLVHYVPLGFLLLGVFLLGCIRYRVKPYRFPPAGFPASPQLFAVFIDVPARICSIIIGFTLHILRLCYEGAVEFLRNWLIRFSFILIDLILAQLLLLGAQVLVAYAMLLLTQHLAMDVPLQQQAFATAGSRLFWFHLMIVGGLTLYTVSAVCFTISYLEEQSWRDGWHSFCGQLSSGLVQPGHLVVRSFIIISLVILAVPIVALLPGSSGFGLFSGAYVALWVVAGGARYCYTRLSRS